MGHNFIADSRLECAVHQALRSLSLDLRYLLFKQEDFLGADFKLVLVNESLDVSDQGTATRVQLHFKLD